MVKNGRNAGTNVTRSSAQVWNCQKIPQIVEPHVSVMLGILRIECNNGTSLLVKFRVLWLKCNSVRITLDNLKQDYCRFETDAPILWDALSVCDSAGRDTGYDGLWAFISLSLTVAERLLTIKGIKQVIHEVINLVHSYNHIISLTGSIVALGH